TAVSSNEGELARSITTSAPASAFRSPSPVMVLTPPLGEAARTSWPRLRKIATAFEPIRPVPPMTTTFMTYLHCDAVRCWALQNPPPCYAGDGGRLLRDCSQFLAIVVATPAARYHRKCLGRTSGA